VLVLVADALVVKVAGPVVAAAAELVWVLRIVVAVIVGGVAVALLDGSVWRWRRRRLGAARTSYPHSRIPVRAAQPLPQERQAPELPVTSRRELPGGLHLHFHVVSAEDAAAILERHRHDG